MVRLIKIGKPPPKPVAPKLTPKVVIREFADLLYHTLMGVKVDTHNDEIIFVLSNGDQYRLYHENDCCETVVIEDVCGDIADLVGWPLLQVEESTSEEPPEGSRANDESNTWTFYKLRTIRGSVDIRWHGSSNGYYSESVSFEKLEDQHKKKI